MGAEEEGREIRWELAVGLYSMVMDGFVQVCNIFTTRMFGRGWWFTIFLFPLFYRLSADAMSLPKRQN